MLAVENCMMPPPCCPHSMEAATEEQPPGAGMIRAVDWADDDRRQQRTAPQTRVGVTSFKQKSTAFSLRVKDLQAENNALQQMG